MNHNDLVALAVKWLQRPNSRGGPGCHFAASELPTGYNGEIPDAYGVKLGGPDEGSTVVEVKTSRSDFLADKKKPHRTKGGIGDWRYYMAPAGLISVSELPVGWGLIDVNARGHIKVVAGALTGIADAGYNSRVMTFESWSCSVNMQRERFLLVKLLSRISDPEKLNRWIREANTVASRASSENNLLREKCRALQLENWELKHKKEGSQCN